MKPKCITDEELRCCYDDSCPRCGKYVACDDEDCEALISPTTLEEYKKAYEHWKDHCYLSGCSHGC